MNNREERYTGVPFCHWKKHRHSLQTPHNEKKQAGYFCLCKRVSLCTFQKGSLTLETALLLPFFLCAVAALICLFSFSSMHARKERTLMEKAQLLAVTAGQEAKEDPYILLYDSTAAKLPFPDVFHAGKRLICKAEVRAWTGYTGERFSGGETERMVYMTPEGSVYHRSRDCTYLQFTIHTIASDRLNDARNLSGGKYAPCEYCIKNHTVPASVYVTDYGTSYHRSGACQGLKRTVMAVPISETGNLRCCSRCGSP